MGLVAAEGPYEIRVYSLPREHPPPHCHVFIKGDGCVRVNLLTMGFMDTSPRGHQSSILRFVQEHRGEALQEWKRLNEQDDDK
jgi:hypothetical protein